jgi:hypothetical protein
VSPDTSHPVAYRSDMATDYAVIELADADGTPRKFWRARAFAAHHPQLGSFDALRKRIERRELNGLAASGAIVESRFGFLIDRDKYQRWLLTPCRPEPRIDAREAIQRVRA